MLLSPMRATIIDSLWQVYLPMSPLMQRLIDAFKAHHLPFPTLDHFALIDLPSSHSGIPTMRSIFERLQFEYRGAGYLPEKQNAFQWLTEIGANSKSAKEVLPQVVVADFNLDALPTKIAQIVAHYAAYAVPFPFIEFDAHWTEAILGNKAAKGALLKLVTAYFAGRAWPLPTRQEIETVQAVNELLAWVLVFGRQPNHFTLSIHLSEHFTTFDAFLTWVENDLGIPLNYQAGRIKGSAQVGIQQASTHAVTERVKVADGEVQLAAPFVEFVWRYPLGYREPPTRFGDYFADFIPTHANNVVESLYDKRR